MSLNTVKPPTLEQLGEVAAELGFACEGWDAALGDAGVDVSNAMEADGLTAVVAANPTRAAARQRLDRLKADPRWFQKLRAGHAEATSDYERLNQDLAG